MAAEAFVSNGVARCGWCAATPDYVRYHDDEWGVPVDDDTRLFEKLCLEGFQSGLSWLTILNKRENFRAAFAGFDIPSVAAFGDDDVARLLADAGIVRHRGKIEAAVNNARRAQELIADEGSLAGYLWSYEPAQQPEPATLTTSPESVALSKDLKKRGWKFVGPTTMFAMMQAMGMVNDHVADCDYRAVIDRKRADFTRPGTR
ncbi:MAG: DNA-3-methyladenine glycosylase I [Gordonia sp. (in: high G+C Gram-positive bacteria)]|uniref:DNA-3-methyladenine glycosylase I n=1 Tax=Gordonia sp. (in: high G+C Gram-positive bacteria) TaxID=84139 RepID=UPI0039E6AE14